MALTVVGALENENTTEAKCAAVTLQMYCANTLREQIAQIERAIKGTCMSGSQLIVNSNRLGAEAAAGVQS